MKYQLMIIYKFILIFLNPVHIKKAGFLKIINNKSICQKQIHHGGRQK